MDNWISVREVYESEEEWLKARDFGIGASEVAAVLGAGYESQSPVTVWSRKTGKPQPELTAEQLKRFRLGHRMESVIAAGFEDETGLIAVDPGSFTIFRHPEIRWLFATLDRFTIHPEFGPMPVELKAVNGRFRSEWEEGEPPLKFQIQCQVQMFCTGASHCYLVALIGGDELVVRLLERNDKFVEAMLDKVSDFWGFVERDELPPVDQSNATKDALRWIFPADDGEEVALPAEFVEMDEKLVELKNQRKVIDAEITGIENQIKAAIGDASKGRLVTGAAYSWKTQRRDEYVVKASEFRVLKRTNK